MYEDTLKSCAEEILGEGVNEVEIEELILQEMAWTAQSSIHVTSIKQVTDGEEHIQ